MAFLSASDEHAIKQEFQKLKDPVKLSVFASELGPETNTQTLQLAREVAALSDKLSVEALNPHIDREKAEGYGIEETPAIVIEGARDYGIRFFGVPAGYEFRSFLDAILAASTGESNLAPETRAALAGLREQVTIKVFSTPG